MPYRDKRFSSIVHHTLAKILVNDLEDSSLKFTSITEVIMSPDLKKARIYVISPHISRIELIERLNKAKNYIKKKLAQNIYAKHIPELVFLYSEKPPSLDSYEKNISSEKE